MSRRRVAIAGLILGGAFGTGLFVAFRDDGAITKERLSAEVFVDDSVSACVLAGLRGRGFDLQRFDIFLGATDDVLSDDDQDLVADVIGDCVGDRPVAEAWIAQSGDPTVSSPGADGNEELAVGDERQAVVVVDDVVPVAAHNRD